MRKRAHDFILASGFLYLAEHVRNLVLMLKLKTGTILDNCIVANALNHWLTMTTTFLLFRFVCHSIDSIDNFNAYIYTSDQR